MLHDTSRTQNPSRHDLAHHPAMDVSEPEVAATVAEGQAFVIQAHQVQDGGVQVVVVDAVLDGAVAELVGGAMDMAALDAAAGQPHAEAEAVMIATPALRG